jgi:hypothetical protein
MSSDSPFSVNSSVSAAAAAAACSSHRHRSHRGNANSKRKPVQSNNTTVFVQHKHPRFDHDTIITDFLDEIEQRNLKKRQEEVSAAQEEVSAAPAAETSQNLAWLDAGAGSDADTEYEQHPASVSSSTSSAYSASAAAASSSSSSSSAAPAPAPGPSADAALRPLRRLSPFNDCLITAIEKKLITVDGNNILEKVIATVACPCEDCFETDIHVRISHVLLGHHDDQPQPIETQAHFEYAASAAAAATSSEPASSSADVMPGAQLQLLDTLAHYRSLLGADALLRCPSCWTRLQVDGLCTNQPAAYEPSVGNLEAECRTSHHCDICHWCVDIKSDDDVFHLFHCDKCGTHLHDGPRVDEKFQGRSCPLFAIIKIFSKENDETKAKNKKQPQTDSKDTQSGPRARGQFPMKRKSNKPKRIPKHRTPEAIIARLTADGSIEEKDIVGDCVISGISKGYIKLDGTNPLDTIVASFPCDECATNNDVTVRQLIKQPDFCGDYTDPEGGAYQCINEYCGNVQFVTGVCKRPPWRAGRPSNIQLDNGKFHHHCAECHDCVFSRRSAHCPHCSNHFTVWQDIGGECLCEGFDRENFRPCSEACDYKEIVDSESDELICRPRDLLAQRLLRDEVPQAIKRYVFGGGFTAEGIRRHRQTSHWQTGAGFSDGIGMMLDVIVGLGHCARHVHHLDEFLLRAEAEQLDFETLDSRASAGRTPMW